MDLTLFKNTIYKDYLILLYGIPFIALVTSIVGTEYSLLYILEKPTFLWMVLLSYLEVLGIWLSFRFSLIKIEQQLPFTLENSKQRLLIQMLVMFVLYILFRLLFIPINEIFFDRPFNWRIHFNSDLPLAILFIILINMLYYHWAWGHLIQQKAAPIPVPSSQSLSSSSKPTTIASQKGKKTILINVEEIAYFYKKDGLTHVKKFNGDSFLLDESLKSITQTYNLAHFYRANRQFLINHAAIQSYETLPNRQLQVLLHPVSPISCKVNKNNLKAFREWLQEVQ